MGFIKAFSGALGGTFADQWKDFYKPVDMISSTVAVLPAIQHSTNADRGTNYKGSENIITNGSKIVVPEGMALITVQDGAITGFITEPGGFIYTSDDPNSKSMFSGDGFLASTLKESWDRFKFGGIPGSEQLAFYINLKEISGNKFGTRDTVYWNDSYLDLKAGGMANGTYSIRIIDPILFVKKYVPMTYLRPEAKPFDFSSLGEEASDQLFNEFVTCLSGAISKLSGQAKMQNMDTMEFIQSNQAQFAQSMSMEVENVYHWSTDRGITVGNVSITINYDSKTQEILEEVRQDDKEIRKAKRMGAAYQDNMAGMVAADSGAAMKAAAANENGAMMGFMGFNMANQAGANMFGSVNGQQMNNQVNNSTEVSQTSNNENSYDKLIELKKLLDAGVITQADFDTAKAKILGI